MTELFIENTRVEISAGLSSLLTFAIDDVKEFASRQTTFSKTITLPGTGNNNKLFGHIFETGISNAYDSLLDNVGYNFNASKSARCLMFQDNLQAFKGTVRLLQINKDKKNIEYEIALNGELTNLNVLLRSAYLDDLDFSAYDESWTTANIIASWDNPGGSGIYYPLIDYGNYGRYLGASGKHDWDFRTLRPALYVKEYIDKMFTAAGYRYESNLFDTARFKGLIIPHNRKKLQKYVTTQVSGSRADSSQVINSGTPYTVPLEMSSVVISSSFTSTNGDSRFTYVGTNPITLNVAYSFTGSYKANLNGWIVELKKNGMVIAGTTIVIPVAGDTTTRFYNFNGNLTVNFATGDYIEIVLTAGGTITVAGTDNITASSGTFQITSDIATITEVVYGGFIDTNEALPKNVRQIDFLSSIIKLFNLYVYESKFDDKLIFIEPFVDFYSTDSSNSVNWTYKLNRDQGVKIKPMSEVNSKTYNFKYKDDSDFYNDLYKKRYNQGYGSYIFDSEFEFASSANSLELIFAATPLVGYVGEDKVYPTIFKRSGPDTAPVEENVDSVIRILQTKKMTGLSSWDIMDDTTVLDSTTDYGYAGHFDDPDNPGNDLNFGVLKELFFTLVTGNLTVTQFNVYWSSYMAEICDKDSKMLTGKFYLTPRDIFDLDFSKYIVLDSVLWRLNKITDYNTTIPNDCEVELLRAINTLY